MAKLGGISLADPNGPVTSGAAFLLTAPSKISETFDVFGIGELAVLSGNPYVVARHSCCDPDQLYFWGFEVAQKGLDLLSVTGKGDLSLRDFTDEYILWWPAGKGQAVRITGTFTMKADVPPLTLTLKDAAGHVIPPAPPPRVEHHPAFRYYRLSQLTDDLQDAMRNTYLAFELVLSDKYPKGPERERDWLKRSLGELAKDPIFKAAFGKPEDEFVAHFMNTVYVQARLPLFHAKIDRDYYQPQSVAEERSVLTATLVDLTRLLTRIFERWYNVRRMGGGLYPKFVYKIMEQSLDGARMVASAHGVHDRGEKDLSHPRFKTAVVVETRVCWFPH